MAAAGVSSVGSSDPDPSGDALRIIGVVSFILERRGRGEGGREGGKEGRGTGWELMLRL